MVFLRMLRDLYWSSPQTTFVVYPLTTLIAESVRGRVPTPDLRFAPLLLWGYLQYRLCGDYRNGHRAGGRGMQTLPDRLLTTGPYGFCRNPMYLGHLIFSLGLMLVLRSPVAVVLAVCRCVYFTQRVQWDEERLLRRFGGEYEAYRGRVKRWLPGLL